MLFDHILLCLFVSKMSVDYILYATATATYSYGTSHSLNNLSIRFDLFRRLQNFIRTDQIRYSFLRLTLSII